MTASRRRRLHLVSAIILISVIGLSTWVFLIEPNRLVLREETISLPNWPNGLNLRLAVIGDIHAGSPFIGTDKLQQIVSRTNAEHPDLIVMLGDFVMQKNYRWGHLIEPEVIAEDLKGLHAPLGVFAVLGNHDWVYNGQRVRQALENVGVRVLENEVASLQHKGQRLFLVGLADLWTRPQQIAETLARIPQGEIVIALTHNPDIFPNIPVTVSLTVAAHTHGGQVNLPVLGRAIVPSHYGQRYAAGSVFENGKHLFVTTGIGTSILPMRFRVPPEIVILRLGPYLQG